MTCAATFDVDRPRIGASYPEELVTVRCEGEIDHSGDHHGHTPGQTGICWPNVITCARCGKTTTDPDKWDPEADTGRVLCNHCWVIEHPHGQ